jgi:HEAT repeat protein
MKTEQTPGGEGGEEPSERPRRKGRRRLHLYLTLPFFAAVLTISLSSLLAMARRQPDAYDSLETIRNGAPRARWRAAGALASTLADPSRIPQDDAFAGTLLELFNDRTLKDIDRRIHLYLGLAMGRVADPRFYAPLLAALEAAPAGSEARAVYVRALGLMRDDRAIPVLLPLLQADDTAVRHEAVQALGSLGGEQARTGLQSMLEDREANVRWDAAVGLAKMGDPAGKDVLLNLLDRDYYAHFPDVRQEGRAWAMETAVRTGARLNDPDINQRIREISTSDPNLRVRGVALEMLETHGIEA